MASRKKIAYQEFGEVASTGGESEVIELPPQEQHPRIQATRKGKKGKTVTLITDLQLKESSLKALLKKLKATCGSGGTLKENTLEIQGDHRQKILAYLVKSGYKAKISGG